MMSTVAKSTFPVLKMSCASCAVSVESILKDTAGVADAVVNFANQTAAVQYDSDRTSPAVLKKAVQSIGYDLLVEPMENLQETTDKLQKEELHQLRFRTIWSVGLAVPVAVLGMFFMHLPFVNYIMLALSAPVVFGFGFHFFRNAFKQALHGRTNMDTLVAVSTGAAFVFSLFNTFFPEYWHSRGLHAYVYYEAAAVVIAFVSLGKWLEEKAKSGTSTAIRKLIGLQPKTVHMIDAAGIETERDVLLVKAGDMIVVKSGEKIPVDGLVEDGSSYVDESSITGEPLPALKQPGDQVYTGTINQQGTFRFKAEKVGNETVIAQIIKQVQEAQGSKAPIQKSVDKIAGVFVPVVMAISVATFCIWWFWGGENAFSQGLLASVTVLVIACPCALGLATPTAIMVGIGKGAENNILIKDAESLELAHRVNAVVLDKTGTITEGKPSVQELVWNSAENKPISVLAAIEAASTHPLAHAVVAYTQPYRVETRILAQYENIPGKGAKANVDGQSYYVGNLKLMLENGIAVSSYLTHAIENWSSKVYTVVYFSGAKEVLAVIAIADKIKPHSAQAIMELKKQGIEVYMLTGDNEQTAKAVAQQAGIAGYRSEVLPSDKAAFIQQLQASGKTVAMVGDGINDAHALAQADVSIAMGKGADIAIDVAKMTLLTSDLMAVSKAFYLSRKTVSMINQNLFWAFVYNIIGIPIAAGVLYPVWGIMPDPMMASAAMALSSVSVVGNSLRLKSL